MSGTFGKSAEVWLKRPQNGIIPVDFMDEFWRSMKPTNTSKNTAMGYSAAYPTMRRRSSASEGSLAKGEPEGTARGRARSVVFFKVSSFWFLVSGSGLVGIKAAKNAKVAKRI